MESTVKVYDLAKHEVGEESLPEDVFGAATNRALVHEAVKHYLAEARSGTHDTKTRGEVQGAGRKLWKQKKTGQARIGSIRSPLWRHGGTVHGPTPRSYGFAFPKKKRQGALRAAVSEKLREGRILVVRDLELSSHKTAELVKSLEALGVVKGALILDEPIGRNLMLAARNLPRCKVLRSASLNIVDLLKYEYLVMSTSAAKVLAEVLAA
ncbi:MAG: 50S ribosomal protein L4 [Acidobacteria bacterium]|nr:50S ribosomal protein L4 [Acidobacteriota bacterium]